MCVPAQRFNLRIHVEDREHPVCLPILVGLFTMSVSKISVLW